MSNRHRTCITPGCSTHRYPVRSPHRPCTWGVLDIPEPGNVTGLTTFYRLPDGTAEVRVSHHRAGQWTEPAPVPTADAAALIAAHRPPIFAATAPGL